MGYKGGGIGINGQGMIQPLEVMQRPRLASLGYNEGQYSKVSEAPNAWLKTLGKEIYGNTSPSSHGSACCNERTEVSSRHHDCTKDHRERYNKSRYSQVHFYYKHVDNHRQKSWHRKTCHFCGLHNHVIGECWKRMATQKRMRREKPSPSQEKKKVKQVSRMKTHCNDCDISGHQISTYCRLHPEQRLKGKVSMHEPVETTIRQASVPQRDDPFNLISERWVF